jgi:histidyl-tRNA synthetase
MRTFLYFILFFYNNIAFQDFDIAGQYAPMITEAECLKVADQVLRKLDLGEYEIRLNHRVLLEGMFALAGIDPKVFKIVCSSVDKLDKVEWDEVRAELINEKKIDAEAVDKLKQFVLARSKLSLKEIFHLFAESIANPTNEKVFDFFKQFDNAQIKTALEELRVLLEYCDLFDCGKNVVFEPSLARGLDYYTGAIYEAVVTKFNFEAEETPDGSFSVGSVAAGGRYDKLVGMFKESVGKKKPEDVPCVGISFGIERLFSIMEAKEKAEAKAKAKVSILFN